MLEPYTIAMSTIGLLTLFTHRRSVKHFGKARLLLSISVSALLLISLPCVSFLAAGSLEWQVANPTRATDRPAAIVILSGYMRDSENVLETPLGDDTIRRCLVGLSLYRHNGPLPVLVTGGRVDPESQVPILAEEMSKLMISNGVRSDDLITESTSRTTAENARNSARILHERGFTCVLLVTDAIHMPRSTLCFASHGIDVIPIGCNRRADRLELGIRSFVPSAHAAQDFNAVAHEWVGLLWYWATDKI